MRISYVTPMYNDEGYIHEYLDSMKKILTDEDELLIIDDCSTDKSRKEVHRWIDNDDYGYRLNFRLIQNTENIGMPKNCNKLIKEACGDVIVWSDVDYYFPNKGDIIRKHLTNDVDLLHTDYYKLIDDNKRRINVRSHFDRRGKSKIQMSTVAEWKSISLQFPFRETYTWHNLYFERFLRMNRDGVVFSHVAEPTTIWRRRVGNYDRHKSEIDLIQKQIYEEYGVKL